LEIAVPGKHAFTLDRAHRIDGDFAGDCRGSLEISLRIKRLLDAHSTGGAAGIRLNIGGRSVAIPTDFNRLFVLYSSVELLRIKDWIEVIPTDDFRFDPNLREAVASLQREMGGFRDCQKVERLDLSRSVEVVGRIAFSVEAARARMSLFLTDRGKSRHPLLH
jgi:hypothetical protein